MAFHIVVRAPKGQLLFRTHAEARELGMRLTDCCPHLIALCLMVDHIHLILADADEDRRVHDALSAYARWRNHTRGHEGPVFEPRPPPEEIGGPEHLQRTIRYVHLNPPRKGLVDDRLAWPWSTHRDYVGLAIPTVTLPRTDPDRFHRYVSSDPTVHVLGTELPAGRPGDFDLEQVCAAVSAICRAPLHHLLQRGLPRKLALQAAWLHGFRDTGLLGTRFGCGGSTVWRAVADLSPGKVRAKAPELRVVLRVVGDPRFPALHAGDQRGTWRPYRRLV